VFSKWALNPPTNAINSDDEAMIDVSNNQYNENGMLEHIIDYNSAGADGDWLTSSDNNVTVIRYQQFIPMHTLSE
jgi:hypothetical protein